MIYGCKSDRPVSRICSPALFSYRCLHSEPRWHQTTCAVYCCYDLEPHQTEIVSRSRGGSRRRGWQQLAVVSTCHSSLPLQLGAHKSLGNGSEIAGWRIPIEQNPNSVRCTFNGDYDLWILANRTQQTLDVFYRHELCELDVVWSLLFKNPAGDCLSQMGSRAFRWEVVPGKSRVFDYSTSIFSGNLTAVSSDGLTQTFWGLPENVGT